MWHRDVVLTTAREIRGQLRRLLPPEEAPLAEAEMDAILRRADAGEDVTEGLLAVLRRREATRQAALTAVRGERGYQPLLGAAVGVGARYVCPVADCDKVGDRLDDSEPEPRCPVHGVRMQRI